MNAAEIMTEDVVTIDRSATLGEALDVFFASPFRHLPVLSEEGEVVGILSDRDLRSLGISVVTDIERLDATRDQLRAPVTTAMSSDVISVTPDTDVEEVIDRMVEEQIGAVPVIDRHTNDLVGMVSYVDVLRALRDVLADERGH